jgi:trk system potassium uptake protein
MRKVVVVGLGRFGMAVARQLASTSVQVIGVDTDRDVIDDIKDEVDAAVVLDSTDEVAFRSQDLHKAQVLVVAIGEDFESAVLTTVLGKKLGIPRVICRASSAIHAEIFRQIGADEVVQPEVETGQQLARKLAHPFLEDFVDLGEGFTLIELRAPAAFRDKTLRELNLRARYQVNLVAIRRTIVEPSAKGEQTRQQLSIPQPDDVIGANDMLIFIGATSDLGRIPKE